MVLFHSVRKATGSFVTIPVIFGVVAYLVGNWKVRELLIRTHVHIYSVYIYIYYVDIGQTLLDLNVQLSMMDHDGLLP